MTAVLAGLRALGPVKLAALALVAVLSLGMVGLLALHDGSAPMALLYGDLDLREAGQVVDALDRAKIPHQTDPAGTRILVPGDQVARARMLLAKDGLPSGGSIGYEIFDRADGLTASAFQQSISQSRAMEGELARTIRTLQGVRAARVHLVLPRREPFARDRQEAQASVLITMAGAARLDREGVQAVLNLIAAAVPGLKPQNIAVVDSRGNLLARAGQPTAGLAAAQTGEELKRAAEARISRAVEEMLERTIGPGRVRADASVDLDFDQVHETQEKYDPEGQVVRSQQTSSGNSKTTEQAQNVSVQNNLPNADPAAAAGGSTDQKSEETTNYEISKTIRTMVRDQPQLKRLSLAVMVDGVVTAGADGKPAWAPRPEEELARIASLVRSAVGFDEKRGDRVEVVSMRFTAPEEGPEAAALPLWAQFDKADVVRLIEAGLLTLAVILCLLMVFRPMVLRIALAQPQLLAAGAGGVAIDGLTGVDAALEDGAPRPAGSAALPGAAAEEVMRLANVEGELRVASLRRVADLVAAHPDETLAMVRNWITPDNDR
jgi:flagellar M-ring protein FliF